jgi:hypothetical protein
MFRSISGHPQVKNLSLQHTEEELYITYVQNFMHLRNV